MTPTLWDLDKQMVYSDAKRFFAGVKNTSHDKFKVGQRVTFWTGHNDDIRAVATIKAISGDDIYVYTDCYWYPIKDNETYAIEEA